MSAQCPLQPCSLVLVSEAHSPLLQSSVGGPCLLIQSPAEGHWSHFQSGVITNSSEHSCVSFCMDMTVEFQAHICLELTCCCIPMAVVRMESGYTAPAPCLTSSRPLVFFPLELCGLVRDGGWKSRNWPKGAKLICIF